MKKRLLFISIALLLLLAACGKENETTNSSKKEIDPSIPIKVDLDVPEKDEKDKPIDLKATVTQDGEPVDDASDVQYEIWADGAKDDSDMIEAKNGKDGTYISSHTFDKDAVYTVQVHVTAREQHQMPSKKITIGKAESDHHDHDHGSDHHSDSFSMHFMKPENVKKDAAVNLVVHLEDGNKPLEKANVRYEIWQKDKEKHDWVNAKESAAGQYEAEHSFKQKGMYMIQVHVENDYGLHEHETHEVTVE